MNRVSPRSDQFVVLSFPGLPAKSSQLFLEAETDHYDASHCNARGRAEYLVVHWEKVYNINSEQKRISIALPGAIRKITAQGLDHKNLTVSFVWKKMPQLDIVTITGNFCRSNSFKLKENNCDEIGFGGDYIECHSLRMTRFDYAVQKHLPPLSDVRPLIRPFRYNRLRRERHNSFTCVSKVRKAKKKYSWIETVKTCKDKGMSLPEFFSRRDQDELLYLLKTTSEDTSMFPIKALFIGLHGFFGQVTRRCFFSLTDLKQRSCINITRYSGGGSPTT